MARKRNDYPRLMSFRLDEALYNKIKNGSKNAGITCGEFIRKQLTTGRITVKQEIIADVPQLKRLIAEFGKIGSNINQIAHHLNGGGIATHDLCEQLNKTLSDLYSMKYEVEQMGGEFRGYSQAHTRKKQ